MWKHAAPIEVHKAALMATPGALVRRPPVASRIGAVAFGLFAAGIGVNGLIDPSADLGRRIFAPVWGVGTLVWAVGAARSVLIVTDDLLFVRNSLFRTWTVRWTDVNEIEPGHRGLCFAARDGRRVVANATAKLNLDMLKPRVDKALLAELRARLRPS